jgi:hypothetical protein
MSAIEESNDPVSVESRRSATIGKLALALSKAQGVMTGAAKANENPFFHSKYADLASVWDACRGPLSSNELAVIQTVVPSSGPGKIAIETLLAHSSDEWISGTVEMKPVKDDPQGVGSAITYARRYGLQAIVGIAPEDDDGNAASGKNGKDQQQQRKDPPKSTTIGNPPPQESPAYISDKQLARFHAIWQNKGWNENDVKAVLKDFGVSSSKHIIRADYEKICHIVENLDYPGYLDQKTNPPAA